MSDIETLAVMHYASGDSPIGYAVKVVEQFIDLHVMINADRHDDPQAWSAYGPDTSSGHMARRAVSWLLNAGWAPPSGETIALAVAEHTARMAWLEQHFGHPCRCGHAIAAHTEAPGSRCADCPDCWAWKCEHAS